jgi:phospholipid-translocating ATPase
MIPQSLKITSDLCKYILSWLITYDIKIYDEKSDTAAGVSNTAICEDLGQIEYLFTDKTGTLTENIMIFKKCIVNSHIYECDPVNNKLKNDLQSGDENLLKFMQTIVLCNSMHSSIDDRGRIHFLSNSPDEEALVNFAMEHDVKLLSNDHDSIRYSFFGNEQEYKILNTLEFSSARRRMSIIVKSIRDGNIIVFSKGADDAIFSILEQNDADILIYKEHVKQLAMDGLRTLCMAYKPLTDDEYQQWSKQFQQANLATENRSEQVEKVYSMIEKGLVYIGCSGIEDALQEDVPETIQSLRDAGIVVWMLTGDKKETAMIIGYSCKLIIRQTSDYRGTYIIHLEGNSPEELSESLERALVELEQIDKTVSIACLCM